MAVEIEAGREIAVRNPVGVHRDDVLESVLLAEARAGFDGVGDLPLVHGVEEVAVMHKKAQRSLALGLHDRQKHVEAEDLLLADAFALVRTARDFHPQAFAGRLDLEDGRTLGDRSG